MVIFHSYVSLQEGILGIPFLTNKNKGRPFWLLNSVQLIFMFSHRFRHDFSLMLLACSVCSFASCGGALAAFLLGRAWLDVPPSVAAGQFMAW
jgi:CHASE2 domain-containing sensor protein